MVRGICGSERPPAEVGEVGDQRDRSDQDLGGRGRGERDHDGEHRDERIAALERRRDPVEVIVLERRLQRRCDQQAGR